MTYALVATLVGGCAFAPEPGAYGLTDADSIETDCAGLGEPYGDWAYLDGVGFLLDDLEDDRFNWALFWSSGGGGIFDLPCQLDGQAYSCLRTWQSDTTSTRVRASGAWSGPDEALLFWDVEVACPDDEPECAADLPVEQQPCSFVEATHLVR